MNQFDALIGFMNAAVAIAGFTGIIALIDRRAAHTSHEVASFRIRGLLGASLCVLFLSGIPIFLTAFKVPDDITWRISCVALALVGSGYAAMALRTKSRLSGAALEGLITAHFYGLTAAGVALVSIASIAALGIIPSMPVFLVGIWWLLFVAAQAFFRLIMMLDESLKHSDS